MERNLGGSPVRCTSGDAGRAGRPGLDARKRSSERGPAAPVAATPDDPPGARCGCRAGRGGCRRVRGDPERPRGGAHVRADPGDHAHGRRDDDHDAAAVHRLGGPGFGRSSPTTRPRRSGLLTFRGNPTRSYYGHGPGAGRAARRVAVPGASACARCRRTAARRRTGAARAGPASRRCSSATGARGWCSARTTAPSTSSTPRPVRTSCRRSRPATSSRDRSPSIPTASRSCTSGSRDGYFRVHRDRPSGSPPSCGSSSATDVSPTKWNDDWDGSALVLDDYLFEGGENSQIHIVKLNRAHRAPTGS